MASNIAALAASRFHSVKMVRPPPITCASKLGVVYGPLPCTATITRSNVVPASAVSHAVRLVSSRFRVTVAIGLIAVKSMSAASIASVPELESLQ